MVHETNIFAKIRHFLLIFSTKLSIFAVLFYNRVYCVFWLVYTSMLAFYCIHTHTHSHKHTHTHTHMHTQLLISEQGQLFSGLGTLSLPFQNNKMIPISTLCCCGKGGSYVKGVLLILIKKWGM